MSSLALHGDFECRAVVDLRKTGVYPYAADRHTGIWCFNFRFGNRGPVRRWVPGQPFPQDVIEHVRSGGLFMAHNAAFERTIWNVVLRRYVPGLPELRIEQMGCTVSRCAVLGIPQSLDVGAKVLGAKHEKDMKGNALMMKMARPRRFDPSGEPVWWDEPENVDRLLQYCDSDVLVETEVDDKAPALSARELRIWQLDQRINDRGVQLDRRTIEHAIKVRDLAKARINKKLKAITGGAVQKGSEVAKIVAWINTQGVSCESVKKDQQEELLIRADEIAPQVREVISLRQQYSKTSTAKYTAMLQCMGEDGRARGLLHFHGANTGRWAGRLIQPQNLYRVDFERDGYAIENITDLLAGYDDPEQSLDMIEMLHGEPMTQLAKCLRPMIIAGPGKVLNGCDLSNIEGRLQAWFGGEQWKLDAFAAYDRGEGPDLYCVAYGAAFGEEPKTVKGQKRQIGKVMELACGYQGSVGSFLNMGSNYGLKPEKLIEPVSRAAPDAFGEWMDRYHKARDKRGLPQEQWAAVKTIVTGWRTTHAGIQQTWWDLQDAAIEACENPGRVVFVCDGKVAYSFAQGCLWCQIPSGKVLCYWNARCVRVTERWLEHPGTGAQAPISDLGIPSEDEEQAVLLSLGYVVKERTKRRVDYEGFEGEKKIWTTFSLYGGMQFNHVVQSTAREVLVDGMFRLEEKGYPIVLTVHDENVAETDAWHGSAEEMATLMTINPEWLPGCPLAAKAWRGPRYAK